MNRLKKTLVTVGIASSLAVGAAGAANAAISYPDGGTWDQGVNHFTGKVWSNYYHPSRAHGSTACNRNDCNPSQIVPGKKWSYASIRSTLSGNTTYYRF